MRAAAADDRPSPLRGLRGTLVPIALAIGAVIVLTLAPMVLADDRDPRCSDWEQHGAPPGLDLATVCPQGPLDVGVDLAREPLVPYIVALLVVAGVLTAFGFVAMRLLAPRPAARHARPEDWWVCASCGTRNRPDRAVCYACQASRAGARAGDPQRADEPAAEPGPATDDAAGG